MAEFILELVKRLIVNLLVLIVIIRFIYYPNNGSYKKAFAYFIMAMMVFLVAALLGRIKFEMGFALGLFAIFSIIRYRTTSVDVKNMAYLFLVLSISAINALVDFYTFWKGIVPVNLFIIILVYILEKYPPRKQYVKKQLTYTPQSMSSAAKPLLLKEELEEYLELRIHKIEIDKIHISRNEVSVYIYYQEE